jgi:hypothetical protein
MPRYRITGEDEPVEPPERRIAMLLSAIMALMLTIPAIIVQVGPNLVSRRRWESVAYILAILWGLTSGWATLPWILVGALVAGFFGTAGDDFNSIPGFFALFVSYFINAMYGLTRVPAGRLFTIVATVAGLQVVVFLLVIAAHR